MNAGPSTRPPGAAPPCCVCARAYTCVLACARWRACVRARARVSILLRVFSDGGHACNCESTRAFPCVYVHASLSIRLSVCFSPLSPLSLSLPPCLPPSLSLSVPLFLPPSLPPSLLPFLPPSLPLSLSLPPSLSLFLALSHSGRDSPTPQRAFLLPPLTPRLPPAGVPDFDPARDWPGLRHHVMQVRRPRWCVRLEGWAGCCSRCGW